MIVSYNGNIVSLNGSIIDFPITSTVITGSTSNLRLLILGDVSASTVRTSISTQLTSLGYSGFTISAITMGTTYSASGLTPSDYNCVLYYTNSSQIGSSSLPANLLNYRNLGGNIVTGVFTWNLRPTGWSDANVTNFVGSVNQTSNNTNINVLISHPIFSGVSSAITNNTSYFVNDIVSTQSGSTTLANLSSNGRPFLAIRTVGSSRLVSVNTFPVGISTFANMRRLFTNSVLWAVGITN
jgi:hypothetical protein